ncbi:MAG: tRNA (adenosine(37)-N6)-threonylcarbamoyltransferase complex dimerization subunit type 1 TsaB [Bacteroidetes bacterium]|nr:tRNA (adenosine(37)-N6)-threonylcarbamoyltransferase complex dimerization subunit type 1 TsaB [Bacteroidota bacterium]
MTVLGIETATSVCAVALVEGGSVTIEEGIDERHVHAEKLLVFVDRVLKASRRPLEDLDGIAVSIGPGSFTGLRIGLSVGKGLSFAADVPLVGVPTLESLVQRIVDASLPERPDHVLAAIDARRDEVYCQLFQIGDAHHRPVWHPRDLSVAAVIEELGDRDVLLTGDGSPKLLRFLERGKGEVGCRMTAAAPDVARCSAGTVALMGQRLLEEGKKDDLSRLEPRYVKDFFLASRSQ